MDQENSAQRSRMDKKQEFRCICSLGCCNKVPQFWRLAVQKSRCWQGPTSFQTLGGSLPWFFLASGGGPPSLVSLGW